MEGLWDEIQVATAWLRSRWSGTPKAGLILGTGLGGLAERIEVDVEIPYSDIPHFPSSTAPSHAGKLLSLLRRLLPATGHFSHSRHEGDGG
jgi:purine-nucleoside phosphorylase